MPAFLLVVLCVYALISGVTFIAYALDKRAAVRGARRTPERSLHLMELAGGWPGALLAQRTLRHKTRKTSYQVVFWAIVVLHVGLWIAALSLGAG